MTSRHLVADGDLPLLGDIYLCKLHHSVRKVVTDLDLVESPLLACLLFLECNAVVVDEVAYECVGVVFGRPPVGVDVVVVGYVAELVCGDPVALGDEFHTVEVADAGARLALDQGDELVHKLACKLALLDVERLGDAFKACLELLFCTLAVAGLAGLRKEGGLDYGAAQ